MRLSLQYYWQFPAQNSVPDIVHQPSHVTEEFFKRSLSTAQQVASHKYAASSNLKQTVWRLKETSCRMQPVPVTLNFLEYREHPTNDFHSQNTTGMIPGRARRE